MFAWVVSMPLSFSLNSNRKMNVKDTKLGGTTVSQKTFSVRLYFQCGFIRCTVNSLLLQKLNILKFMFNKIFNRCLHSEDPFQI